METYSVELAASLRASFDVDTLVLPGREDGHPPGLAAYSAFVLRAMWFCLRYGRAFPNVVFCDLVLFPAAICHWLVAPRHTRLVVLYGLDLVYHARRGLLPRLYGCFFATFRACQGIFAQLVAISRYTAGLAKDAGLRRIVVINPSLPDNALTNASPTHADLPEAWMRTSHRILYFGRLVPRKGALWYAESVLPLLDEDVALFVVGESSDTGYRERLQRCRRTHCLGRIESARLAAMIRTADVIVMPNIPTPEAVDVEGFGLAAIEASALGGRLLASAIDGITDAVIDGATGTLVPPGDVARWARESAAAIEESASGDGSRRARAATATREAYSRQRQLAAFVDLLHSAEP